MINEKLYKIFEKKEYDKLLESNTNLITAAKSIVYDRMNAELYCKEVVEIKKIYDEIIINYSKINKIFNLKDPVEIYALFTCALKNGYLSKNKEFRNETSDIKNITTIYGAIPITGRGVCRHIAPLLCDVFKKSDIDSNVMTVYKPPTTEQEVDQMIEDYVEEIIRTTQIKPSKEEIEKVKKIYTEIVLQNNPKDKYQIKTTKKYGNHVITVAIKNGKIHLLDATQEKLYKIREKNKKIIIDEHGIKTRIKVKKQTFLGTKQDMKNQKKQLLLPSTTLEEDEKLIDKTISIFQNNIDILDKLYDTNKDLYKEISYKLTKFKK